MPIQIVVPHISKSKSQCQTGTELLLPGAFPGAWSTLETCAALLFQDTNFHSQADLVLKAFHADFAIPTWNGTVTSPSTA